MRKDFRERVLTERIVDTKKYRYAVIGDFAEQRIIRIPIAYIGTTKAIDGWEVVE